MSGSAIATLIFASVVLYGGLFITVRKAVKSRKKEEE
ncbi:MAG: MetS family NSS transporter small subunit [Halanaerobiales bacterium]